MCLSGGASNGYYHLGVLRTLLENGIVPEIISGSSAGALVGAAASVSTDEELLDFLNDPDMWLLFQPVNKDDTLWTWFKNWWATRGIFRAEDWIPKLNALL